MLLKKWKSEIEKERETDRQTDRHGDTHTKERERKTLFVGAIFLAYQVI